MNQLGSADLYSGRLYRSIRLGLPDRTAKDGLRFIRRSFHVPNRVCLFVEGRGSRVTGRGSRVKRRGSRVYGRGSRVTSRGSKNF